MQGLRHPRDRDNKPESNDNRMGLILVAIAVLASGLYSALYFAVA